MAARNGKRSAAKARATSSRSAKARTKKPRASKRAAAPSSAPPVQVARIAKGKKPLYFSDPAIDKLLWMTLTLMEELSVTRDRLDAVERLLDRKRVLRRADVEGYVPDPKAQLERNARRGAYVDRMMRAAQAEIAETTASGNSKVDDEALAAVSS